MHNLYFPVIIFIFLGTANAESPPLALDKQEFSSESERFDFLRKKEKADWLGHFDKEGKFLKDKYKLPQDEQIKFTFTNTVEQNIQEIKNKIQTIPGKVEKMTRISQEFRELRMTVTQEQKEQEDKQSQELDQIFEKYKEQTIQFRKKAYNEFVELGKILKIKIEAGAEQ